MTYTNADKIVAFEFKAITNDGRFLEGRRTADGFEDKYTPRWSSSGGIERDQIDDIVSAIDEHTNWAHPETYPVGTWVVLIGDEWDEDDNAYVQIADTDAGGTYVFLGEGGHRLYVDADNSRLANAAETSMGKYPESDWRYEVASGDTVLGLVEWREHKREADTPVRIIVE